MSGETYAALAARIDAALAEKPDGILEIVASNCGASLLQVLQRLPDDDLRLLPGAQHESVWPHLTAWGEVLLIVHTPDIVLECTGSLPAGTTGHGYFNIHGDSPISGHIKMSNCKVIALVSRQFHGKRSCSVQFLNSDGNAMFKVFVKRNAAHELDPHSLNKFEQMFAAAGIPDRQAS